MDFILVCAKIFTVLVMAKACVTRANGRAGLPRSFFVFMSCFLPASMLFFFLQQEEGGIKKMLTGWLLTGSVGFFVVVILEKLTGSKR